MQKALRDLQSASIIAVTVKFYNLLLWLLLKVFNF